MFPQEVLDGIARGKAYLSDRNVEHISDLKKGCSDCKSNGTCVKRLLRGLDFKVELDEYDDVAIGLYENLMLIIGDYTVVIAPRVDAGANQIVQLGNTATFTATITLGSAAIVSILWEQIAGVSQSTLTNATTASMTASNFEQGSYMYRVTVTDANGLIGFDTVTLGAVIYSGNSTILTTPMGKYSSADRIDDYSILITELIGADLTFFIGHRGIGTVYTGSDLAADETSVQVDVMTGIVTFFQPFSDFEEELWFDYKVNG